MGDGSGGLRLVQLLAFVESMYGGAWHCWGVVGEGGDGWMERRAEQSGAEQISVVVVEINQPVYRRTDGRINSPFQLSVGIEQFATVRMWLRIQRISLVDESRNGKV